MNAGLGYQLAARPTTCPTSVGMRVMSQGAAGDGRVIRQSKKKAAGASGRWPRVARVAAHPCLHSADPHQSRKGCGVDGRARHAAARL